MRAGRSPIKIAIAAGGTGGHISPAIAVLEELQEQGIAYEAIWIGSQGQFEREAAERCAIPYYPIHVGKLRRYVSLRTVTDSIRVPLGIMQARRILARVRPDVVFSTGGYVGVPAVIAARWLRFPSLTHEQTAILGLATRINARFTDTIALSYPSTAEPRKRADARVVVTGNPVRRALYGGCPERIRDAYGFGEVLPIVYVTGGAQGSAAINRAIGDALPDLLEHAQIIHQCGPDAINNDYSRLVQRRAELAPELAERYWPVERVDEELRDIYAAASLVVGRSGAGTVAEIAAFGLPAILIPLPGAAEQSENARVLEQTGGAIVIDQKNLTAGGLAEEILSLLEDGRRRKTMRAGARDLASEDAAKTLVRELLRLAAISDG